VALMADDDDLAPPGGTGTGAKRISCEFCECQLASSGEVLKRSARAKELMKFEEEITELRAELDGARGQVADLETQLGAAKTKIADLEKKASNIIY